MRKLSCTSLSWSASLLGICASFLIPNAATAQPFQGKIAAHQVTTAPTANSPAVHIANTLSRSQRTEREEATQLFYQGEELLNAGDRTSIRKAITAWKIALPIYQELGVVRSQQATFFNLGRAYDKLEEYERAIAYYQQALTIAQSERDTQAQIELSERINNSQTQLDNL